MSIDAEELQRLVQDVQDTAMPKFLEDGSVRIHAITYEAESLVAAAFRNYRNFMWEGG